MGSRCDGGRGRVHRSRGEEELPGQDTSPVKQVQRGPGGALDPRIRAHLPYPRTATSSQLSREYEALPRNPGSRPRDFDKHSLLTLYGPQSAHL